MLNSQATTSRFSSRYAPVSTHGSSKLTRPSCQKHDKLSLVLIRLEERPKERRPEHHSRHNRTRPTAPALRRPREAKGTRTSERYLGSARIDLAPSTPLKTNGAHPPRAFRPAKQASGFPSGFFRRGKKRTVGTRARGRARRTRASLSIDRFSSVCPRGSRAVSARFTHRVNTRARAFGRHVPRIPVPVASNVERK